MNTLKFLFSLLFLATLVVGCKDEMDSPHVLPPLPDKELMFIPYENVLPADSAELAVDAFLWVNDTTFLPVEEWSDLMDWQIKEVNIYESGNLDTRSDVITVTTPLDTIHGDWFTIIREDNGKRLHCIFAPNDGEQRMVWVSTTGVDELHDADCQFIQEKKAQ